MIHYAQTGGYILRKLRLLDRVVYPELNVVVRGEASIRLEPKAMEVLLVLAACPGELISREQLLRSVWGGVFVCDDVVANAVSILRPTLGDRAQNSSLIQT